MILSSLEVTTDKDTSYGALNSNSLTPFNVEMDKVPVVAEIMTPQKRVRKSLERFEFLPALQVDLVAFANRSRPVSTMRAMLLPARPSPRLRYA